MTITTGKGAGCLTRRDVLRGSSLALGGLAVGGGLLRSGRAPAAASDVVGRHAAQLERELDDAPVRYARGDQAAPYFVRDVDSFIEQPASYKRGSSSLYIDSPARGDVHIDVWSDSRQTDGFVYQKVLEAAQSIKSRRSR